MENNKGQSIFLSVVGVATLLVAIVGATFAYFSITVSGNNTASSIKVDTAVLGNVIFTDGTNIDVEKIYPGWVKTKTFTVANTTINSTEQVAYQIKIKSVINTITPVATYGTAFQYSLLGSSSNGGTLVSATNVQLPTAGQELQIGSNGILNGTCTHTYTFTIRLNETGSDQNSLQGKTYEGVLQVYLLNSTGRYTWDPINSTSSAY